MCRRSSPRFGVLRVALDVVEAHATIETPDIVRKVVGEALS